MILIRELSTRAESPGPGCLGRELLFPKDIPEGDHDPGWEVPAEVLVFQEIPQE
jgi:hypothetical protein